MQRSISVRNPDARVDARRLSATLDGGLETLNRRSGVSGKATIETKDRGGMLNPHTGHVTKTTTDEALAIRAGIADGIGVSPGEITEPLLRAIADDETFAYHLTLCKDDPQLFRVLLKEAENSARSRIPHPPIPESSLAVLNRASRSLAKWVASRFECVDAEEYGLRLAACTTCEHLTIPPGNAIYKMASLSGKKTVCGLCGCDVRRKAWLATERCPDVESGESGRWPIR